MPAQDLKRAMAHVSWKSHQNAVANPRAHLRRPIGMEAILGAPMIADPLGLFDCCGVSDGAACAIVTTPDIARGLGKKDLVSVKAIATRRQQRLGKPVRRLGRSYVRNTREAARRAYEEAGIADPVAEIGLTEVHDCFSVTELVTMEDLGLSEEGRACFDILNGRFDRTGALPCQVDGGLKCFGHPVGASGPAHGVRDLHPTQRPGRGAAASEGGFRAVAQSRRRADQQRGGGVDSRSVALT